MASMKKITNSNKKGVPKGTPFYFVFRYNSNLPIQQAEPSDHKH